MSVVWGKVEKLTYHYYEDGLQTFYLQVHLASSLDPHQPQLCEKTPHPRGWISMVYQ